MSLYLVNKLFDRFLPGTFTTATTPQQKVVGGVCKYFYEYTFLRFDLFVGTAVGTRGLIVISSVFAKKTPGSGLAIPMASIYIGARIYKYSRMLLVPIIGFRIWRAVKTNRLHVINMKNFM
jgi:hypothetical protein